MSKKDLYTQIEIRHINDENRMTYLSDLRAAGVTVVLLSGTELFEEGREKDEMFAHIAQEISFFKKEGFRVAFWTNSLGYGIPRSPLFDKLFGHSYRLTEFGGGTCTAVCTTDPAFTDHCREVTRSLIRAGADMILWDDDLVQSVRPGFCCVCPGHLALMRKRMGHDCTPDELRDSFTGAPNARERKFVSSSAANHTTRSCLRASGRTTTSKFPGVRLSAAANTSTAAFICESPSSCAFDYENYTLCTSVLRPLQM